MKNMRYLIAALVVAGCVSGNGYAMDGERESHDAFLRRAEATLLDRDIQYVGIINFLKDRLAKENRAVEAGAERNGQLSEENEELNVKLVDLVGKYTGIKDILSTIKLGGELDVELDDHEKVIEKLRKLEEVLGRYRVLLSKVTPLSATGLLGQELASLFKKNEANGHQEGEEK